MKPYSSWLRALLLTTGLSGAAVQAEDIDIFTGTTEVATGLPNVIFVLDNTSNWARQSQQWPGGYEQGQSEVRAIKNVMREQANKLNVGILEFTTEGNANEDGAFVRFDLQALTDGDGGSIDAFEAELDEILDNIESPIEKRNSNTRYGNLVYDFYNYLAGDDQSFEGAGTPESLVDVNGYSSRFGTFASPLVSENVCADTYMIFIGNPNSSGPAEDDSTNSGNLSALYEALGVDAPDALASVSGTPIPWPEFTTTYNDGEDTDVGVSASCYRDQRQALASCNAEANSDIEECTVAGNCSCASISESATASGGCGRNEYKWNITMPGSTSTEVTVTGEVDETGSAEFNLDDWTKFLHNYGIPFTTTVTTTNEAGEEETETFSENVTVTTYTIDVFNAQQNAETSALLYTAAREGGGRYFQARNEDELEAAIESVVNDILSVATSFAAVTLPLSAENRALSENQVFIGMFRPAKGKRPRWFGNLKQYQLALDAGTPTLADVRLQRAVNANTGFLRECAASFWTSDSGDYWAELGISPPPRGQCTADDLSEYSDWSDFPDGPFVEKGGVAQVTREGGARTIYTVGDGTSLVAIGDDHATDLGGSGVLSYLKGDSPGYTGEADGSEEVMPDSGLRSTIHGDVVHSRPLTINYGGGEVAVFYGVNDGVYRAVNASSGAEKWTFVAPEHFSGIQRLHDNTPLIRYNNEAEDPDLEYVPKQYFFDGSTGQMLDYDDAGDLQTAYIYPTMRRGGRMVYAFDVSDPDADPTLLWRVGCPNLDDDTGCSAGFTNIGQTWSTPIGGYVSGYQVDGADQPIVIFGGGFDDCLNADQAAYPTSACASAKGKRIFILDAETGSKLKEFTTDEPVLGDASVIDVDFDGYIDFAYFADVAGNLYRVSFSTLGDINPEGAVAALAMDDWSITKIGASSDDELRFYNSPTAAAVKGTIFVTIGSGDRERPLETNYPYSSSVENRFYVLIDKPYEEPSEVDLDGDTMVRLTSLPLDPDQAADIFSLAKDGWYLELPDRGEQVVNASAIGGGKVFFNTLQPGGASQGLCQAPLGKGKGYNIDLFSPVYDDGNEIIGDGIPIAPVIVTVYMPPLCESGCDDLPEDPCADGDCELRTVCIGCEGMEPIEIVPTAPPIRRRTYFIEDVDLQR